MSIYTGAEIPLVTIFEGIPKKQAAGPLNPVNPALQKRPAAVPKQQHFSNHLHIRQLNCGSTIPNAIDYAIKFHKKFHVVNARAILRQFVHEHSRRNTHSAAAFAAAAMAAAEAAGAVEGAAVEEAHAYEEYGNGGTMLCANQSGRACEQPAPR